jgi:flavin reductase (DIM6/NTAB) family NADH-FMN oxidoreductase RutF
MSTATEPSRYVPLSLATAVWDRFYSVAPLVLVGTIESDGSPDVAPKHLAMPMSWGFLFGFVCSPDHATYRNAVATEQFTVGFPSPELVLQASLAAGPRDANGQKPTLELMSLSPAHVVDGVLVDGCRVHLECRLERVIDDLEQNSLLIGRIVAAHASERALRAPDSDDHDMLDRVPVLAYVHPGRVASVHETKPFPYHPGYHR